MLCSIVGMLPTSHNLQKITTGLSLTTFFRSKTRIAPKWYLFLHHLALVHIHIFLRVRGRHVFFLKDNLLYMWRNGNSQEAQAQEF